ncbi:MAG: CPBP family intramembrane metalloprotease [Lachnospiraceae bacterium]|nr:CPBP family intramembrane metalloprotease [Lachnospiraceae bacterium]
MRRIGNFFLSIFPTLVILILGFAVTLVMTSIYVIQTGGSLSDITAVLMGTSDLLAYPQMTNLIYGIFGILIFGVWFRRSNKRSSKKEKQAPSIRGFSFHTVMAILFLAIGLQYVSTLATDVVRWIAPDLVSDYNSMMQSGYGTVTLLVAVYTVILSPILEELVFRGLTLRYARRAFPFWIANIWQALLFGLVHMNLVQGIYAFIIGMILGYICYKGGGIRYTILIHIIFNLIGVYFSSLIDLTLAFNEPIVLACGLALTIFAIWLFATDFTPDRRQREDIR